MTTNRTKKVRKLRGSRTYGWGSPKKHRGAGSRGGVGNAGRGKKGQQAMSQVNNEKGSGIGSKGFTLPAIVKKINNPINLSELEKNIEKYVKNKKAVKEKDAVVIDVSALGFNKVLGAGAIKTKMILKAKSFSKIAEKKIKGAKGEAQII
ncbi:MAG: uL15 family ribosomal protein [Candidatus Aenigmarchaeota archaeon]|nr:uL15 family ribosomal protein [Candidatus Aenigmarchaeota archaeon]